MVGSEISWWFRNILPLGSGLIGMVPKYPAARARINRNGSDSSGSEISCDTGIKAIGSVRNIVAGIKAIGSVSHEDP